MLIAPDAFKGTYSAPQVCDCLAEGAEGAEVDRCPVADGGEGTLDVLQSVLDLDRRSFVVADALGRPVSAPIGFGSDGTAVIESATAIGLATIPTAELDPIAASSTGVGELIAQALDQGARRLLVGVGGTATVDGGAGALEVIEAHGGLGDREVQVLCDVETRWERAAAVFAPQKGATPDQVLRLATRLEEVAEALPRDPRGTPMTGAAGGLSGALWALGAELIRGGDCILDLLDFDLRLAAADLVITGEGSLDRQSIEGKLVGRVTVRANHAGIPVVAVVGQVHLDDDGGVGALGLTDVLVAGTPAALQVAGRQLAGAFIEGPRSGGPRESPRPTKRRF